MSVIPAEDNLVVSFAEATRIFNHEQANGGSFVHSTGDAGVQDPESLARNPSWRRVAPPLLNRASQSQAPDRPFHVPDGAGVSVIPATMLGSHEIAANPDRMVEIRNPVSNEVGTGFGFNDEDDYSNPWFSARSRLRVYFAEYLGTLVLVLWGEGTQAQVVAARQQPGDYLSVAWGWGVGFMLAIYISSGISGAHINPAVTISLAVFRKFSWRKVPGYVAAQLLGAFTAAAIIYGVYYGPLQALPEGGMASVLTTGPADLVPSTVSTFFSVFTGAALLMAAISAFTDTGNNPATPGLTPLLLGLVMVGIASSFGYQTGFVLNPARDLGPRLLVWATGNGGKGLWLNDDAYGIWIPTVGAIAGALFGNLLYDLLIYNGRDSPINHNFSRKSKYARKQRLQQQQAYNPSMPFKGEEQGVGMSQRTSDATIAEQRSRDQHHLQVFGSPKLQ